MSNRAASIDTIFSSCSFSFQNFIVEIGSYEEYIIKNIRCKVNYIFEARKNFPDLDGCKNMQ
ncbi:hypothetical protein D5281_18180 [bacterium 1xD42-62]|uniref:Uncharacterized protein n=1 Tax=Parablautia muri TaxID=2320879 RepID=A0A9X5BIL9_9FIRM|nr:hypothetical protein [Parablautia muri]